MDSINRSKRYRDYFYIYLLIWAFGAFFYSQSFDKDFVSIFKRFFLYMLVDAPAIFIMVLFIFPRYLKTSKLLQLILSVAIVNLLTLILYAFCKEIFDLSKFGKIYWDLAFAEAIFELQKNGFRESIHTVFVAGLMTGMQYIDYEQKYLKAEKDRAQAELKLLKAQVDPHFLFNNLNILSSLIKKDTNQADEFVTKFSDLYRYMLSKIEEDFVTLSEELAFLEDYIYLLSQRFGNAYIVEQSITKAQAENYLVLPTALQSLIENAIKHNEGSRAEPLKVEIKIEGELVLISNQIKPKMTKINSTKIGLKNLQARYELLSGKSIQIINNEKDFIVQLPLIKLMKYKEQ